MDMLGVLLGVLYFIGILLMGLGVRKFIKENNEVLSELDRHEGSELGFYFLLGCLVLGSWFSVLYCWVLNKWY